MAACHADDHLGLEFLGRLPVHACVTLFDLCPKAFSFSHAAVSVSAFSWKIVGIAVKKWNYGPFA